MILSQILTFIIYFLSVIFLRKYIDTGIINSLFFGKVILTVIVSWFPIHLAKILVKKIDPSEEQKLMLKV